MFLFSDFMAHIYRYTNKMLPEKWFYLNKTVTLGTCFVYKASFPQLFYPLMTRQFFCDFHEKSEDFCVS